MDAKFCQQNRGVKRSRLLADADMLTKPPDEEVILTEDSCCLVYLTLIIEVV